MDCKFCGKSAYLKDDPDKSYCSKCREMFFWDEIEIELWDQLTTEEPRCYSENKKD